ncbi:hypothetical protein BU17DRAFT_61423 [Hysterangium stoloniferum]|nr:hypothetical protein BU17DRAFT_61423 [Hysterangium stoloniferum]
MPSQARQPLAAACGNFNAVGIPSAVQSTTLHDTNTIDTSKEKNICGRQPVMNETTPLLPTVNSDLGDVNEFPTISSVAETLLANSAGITLESLLDSYPAFLNGTRPIRAVAFRLAVTLYALADKKWRNLPSMPMEQSTLQLLRTSRDQDAQRDKLQNIATIVLGQIPTVVEDVLQHPDVNNVGESSIEDVLLAPFIEHNCIRHRVSFRSFAPTFHSTNNFEG